MAFKLKVQTPTEAQEQMALVTWARMMSLPLIHIPNEGKRTFATAKWLEGMGCIWGASDLFLAVTTKRYGGYFIEMKSRGNKPTKLQQEFLDKMKANGYKADYFDSWEKAKVSIEEYLNAD